MNTTDFYSGLTSALCLEPGETPPEYPNGIIFSKGLTSRGVLVTVTDEVYESFVSASDETRADIIQSVYSRFLN